MGFIIRGFIWDIPILIFAYVLFGGPNNYALPQELQTRYTKIPNPVRLGDQVGVLIVSIFSNIYIPRKLYSNYAGPQYKAQEPSASPVEELHCEY